MTKTPEELTEDWKARKLKVSASMLYSRYYKNNDPTYIFRGIV